MEQNVVNSSCFTDTIYVQNYTLSSSNNQEPYDSCHVEQLKDFKLITKVEEALNVNLNNLDELYALASGELKKNVRLAYLNADGSTILDGFCAWFELSLETGIVVSTNPLNGNASIDQAWESGGAWQSAIFRLKHRFNNTQKLQNLNVIVSAGNGVLKIDHYYDAYGEWERGVLYIANVICHVNYVLFRA